MKVAVITPVFALAGVPLAQVRLAQSLAARGHTVDLLIGRVLDGYSFLPPENVRTKILDQPNVRSLVWPLTRYLWSRKPDVVFSAEDHLNSIVLLAALLSRSRAKISCSSRVTPYDTYSGFRFSKRWIMKQVVRAVMWRADALTCVSKDMVHQYKTIFKASSHTWAYNIVSDASTASRMKEHLDHPWFESHDMPVLVAAGRLAPWKGFSDLIEAMALVSAERKVRLLILGDGPLRSELQKRIQSLGLDSVIQLLGYVENPLKYFFHSDIFVLTSHVEGLPNVLVEAMICGCTPVATDCPTGPREVLGDGRYGYLVEPRNARSIANGILKSLDCRISPELLAQAVKPFKDDVVIDRHFQLLGLSEYSK